MKDKYSLFLLLFLNGTILLAQAKNIAPVPDKVYWYLDFTVTIKGEGKQTNEEEDRIVTWSVDRTYSGVIKLNKTIPWYKPGLSQEESIEARKSSRFTAFHYRPADLTKTLLMPISVRIGDKYNKLIKDIGEGFSFEFTQVNKVWKLNWDTSGKQGFAPNALRLSTDDKLRSYSVFIPLLVDEVSKERVSLFTDTVIIRSAFGYGDQKTHEETPIRLTLESIHSLGIPNVKGIIEDGAIQHLPDGFLFPATYPATIEYDSLKDFPDLQPDHPIFPDVPESKTKVKIRVFYRFSQKSTY